MLPLRRFGEGDRPRGGDTLPGAVRLTGRTGAHRLKFGPPRGSELERGLQIETEGVQRRVVTEAPAVCCNPVFHPFRLDFGPPLQF